MPVYVDDARVPKNGRRWNHVTEAQRELAIAKGAIPVDKRRLVVVARALVKQEAVYAS